MIQKNQVNKKMICFSTYPELSGHKGKSLTKFNYAFSDLPVGLHHRDFDSRVSVLTGGSQ
jgi:hypothetical protein